MNWREQRKQISERSIFLKPCDPSTHNFIWCWLQWAELRGWTRSGCGELFIQLHQCACVCPSVCVCVDGTRWWFLYLLDQDLVRQLGSVVLGRPVGCPLIPPHLTELSRSVRQLFWNIGRRALKVSCTCSPSDPPDIYLTEQGEFFCCFRSDAQRQWPERQIGTNLAIYLSFVLFCLQKQAWVPQHSYFFWLSFFDLLQKSLKQINQNKVRDNAEAVSLSQLWC